MKDEIKIKKKNFLLCNCPYPNKKIFKLITKNIPNSIFTILDFSFFKEMVNKKIIDLYIIKKKQKNFFYYNCYIFQKLSKTQKKYY